MSHPRLTSAELVAHLERLGAKPGDVIAFDGDGTLWSGDVGEDIFNAALDQRVLPGCALAPLQALALSYGCDVVPNIHDQARALFAAYQRGTLPEHVTCEFMTWCFAGWKRDSLLSWVGDVLHASGLESRLFAPIGPILSWAERSGIDTIVVSASPEFAVRPAAKLWGITPEQVVACVALLDTDDVLTTKLAGPVPYGERKVSAAHQLLGGRRLLAAFGDNGFDLELLQSSVLPVATRPKPALSAVLGRLETAVELID